jgi:hypothetical protein
LIAAAGRAEQAADLEVAGGGRRSVLARTRVRVGGRIVAVVSRRALSRRTVFARVLMVGAFASFGVPWRGPVRPRAR